MKALLFATTATIVAIGGLGAMAADLKEPVVVTKAPLIQVYDWTGFYVGINAGGGWGSTETTGNNVTVANNRGSATLDLNQLAISNNNMNGLIAGGQIGYNYQFGAVPIVVGLEADGDWSGIKGSGPCAPMVLGNCTQTDKLNWTADVAGRIGYAFANFLPYFKGGVAWGSFDHDFRVPVGNINNGADVITGGSSKVQTGFLIGAGLEYAIGPHLTAKVEYNFLDFGTQTDSVAFTGPSLGNSTVLVNTTFKDQVSVFKGGLNYKF